MPQITLKDYSPCSPYFALARLVVGEAVSMPVRALIDLPPEERRPDSEDPEVVVRRLPSGERKRPGGWTDSLAKQDYKPLVEAWRDQDPHSSVTVADTAVPNNVQEKK